MSTSKFKYTKNRIFLSHNDGLIDLFIGFAILFAGLFLWTEMVWMAGIFVPVLLPSFQAAQKRFLEPRIGELSQNYQQQVQSQKVVFSITLLLGVLLLGGVGMFFAFGFTTGPFNNWLRQYFLLIIGVIFSSVWLFAAAMQKINRFYLYAAFTFMALATAQFTALPFWIALVVLGGLIASVGLLILIRFIEQHPVAA